jgi:hypothetical protein
LAQRERLHCASDFHKYSIFNIDGFVKSPLGPLIVIPAKAGIQAFQAIMDSCLRRNDAIFDFLRFRQYPIVNSGLCDQGVSSQ